MWSDVRPETGNTGPDGINGELGVNSGKKQIVDNSLQRMSLSNDIRCGDLGRLGAFTVATGQERYINPEFPEYHDDRDNDRA